MAQYELRCRECGQTWGNQPRSICDDCFSPLEVSYDYEAARAEFTREKIAQRPANMWRYSDLLPLPPDFQPKFPVGFTPLLSTSNLAKQIGAHRLHIKNDAVCLPTLSFKDRVVAVALSQARSFGFDTVSCSSTGNLANAVAAQGAGKGFGHAGVWREGGAHRRKLRSGQSPVLADCRPASLGIRERKSAPLLRGRVEDGGFRDRRTVRLAVARQRRRPHGWGFADYKD